MVKSREDSIIEIWGTKYINRDVNRLQEDIMMIFMNIRI